MNQLNIAFKILFFYLSVFFLGCKSTRVVTSTNTSINRSLTKRQLIKTHKKTACDFNTLQAKVKIDVKSGDTDNGYSVSLRVEKDKIIWLSAPLGLVRAKITKEEVQFYNKLDKSYYRGDYNFFSKYLGVTVNFEMLQDLILGNFLKDIQPSQTTLNYKDDTYNLIALNKDFFDLIYRINPSHFRLNHQKIVDHKNERLLAVSYVSYQDIDNSIIPDKIAIVATEDLKNTEVSLEVKSVQLNQELRYPYTVPSDYKLLTLNE